MFRRHGVPQSRLEFLRSLPIFDGVPDKVLARIDGLVTEASFDSGEVLTKQGSLSSEAFIVADGKAEVRVDGEVVGEAEVGELLGELGVLGKTTRTATVIATSPMTLLVLNSRELFSLVREEGMEERVRQNIERHQRGPQPKG